MARCLHTSTFTFTGASRDLEPIVIALGTWALAAPPTAEQLFLSADSAMLAVRSSFVPTRERPEAMLRIELRDHGPAGVFGVHARRPAHVPTVAGTAAAPLDLQHPLVKLDPVTSPGRMDVRVGAGAGASRRPRCR